MNLVYDLRLERLSCGFRAAGSTTGWETVKAGGEAWPQAGWNSPRDGKGSNLVEMTSGLPTLPLL